MILFSSVHRPRWLLGQLTLPLLAAVLGLPSIQAEVRLITGDANNRVFFANAFLTDLSTDGRRALFATSPSLPVFGGPPPGIAVEGLYLRDLTANTLTFTGAQVIGASASLSDDGRYVSWSDTANQIHWRDLQTGTSRLITPGADGFSQNPILSADGRYVAFISLARNLVATTALLPAAGRAAVYLYDSLSQSTTLVSVTHEGKGLSTGVGFAAPQYEFTFSADGQYVFFSTDAAGVHPDRTKAGAIPYFWLYRRHLASGQVDIVCRNGDGLIPIGNFTSPHCDTTGNRVLFTGSFVGLGGGPTLVPGYSAVFGSDLYVKDLKSAEVWWATHTTNGTSPDAQIVGAALSSDGRVVAFSSDGVKFVAENTDPAPFSDSVDVFRAELGAAGAVATTWISKAAVGGRNVGVFGPPYVGGAGDYVAFGTPDVASMVGQATDSYDYHAVAVGQFPGVTVPAPALTVSAGATTIDLAWPETSGYQLESAPALGGPWSAVGEAPILVNQQRRLSVVAGPLPGPHFYRLRKP